MGSYRNDDEALTGLARQLADAYGEARTREDQDYACDSIAQYLSEFRESAPGEALLALFDLPLTAETYPLVDEAQATLAARGPAIVELLLEAALGEVYDPAGPAPDRAAETLDSMEPRELSMGLTEVLCGAGDEQLKDAALDAIVALGGVAEPDLVVTLDDPVGGVWGQAALEQLRIEREHPDATYEEIAADDSLDNEAPGDDEAPDGLDDADGEDGGADASAFAADEGPEQRPATAGLPAGPDQDLVDDAYTDFLRRYEQESGGGASGRRGDPPADTTGDSTAP